ncbi:MAG TPA: 3-keto-5-aminohexanoate cleavage protein, partial [Acetobacteraceae bacterium]|nr:3-keto-5-aminohexanoate cleavage protein [Acetobacteraceae bacterium]
MSVEERLRPAATFQPEVASLNMASMNFGLFPMLQRYSEFKHAWEPEMLEASRDLVFRNSFKDIEYVLSTMSQSGTRFEFECYDTAHLYNLHHFIELGLVKPPLFVHVRDSRWHR